MKLDYHTKFTVISTTVQCERLTTEKCDEFHFREIQNNRI